MRTFSAFIVNMAITTHTLQLIRALHSYMDCYSGTNTGCTASSWTCAGSQRVPDPAGNHVDHHSVATTDTDPTNQLVYKAVIMVPIVQPASMFPRLFPSLLLAIHAFQTECTRKNCFLKMQKQIRFTPHILYHLTAKHHSHLDPTGIGQDTA